MRGNPVVLAFVAIFIFLHAALAEEVLAAGTYIEARLSTPTGSRISHPGDPIQATVIAPVVVDGQVIIPQGATLSGVVKTVERLGLGLKHLTATIEYLFEKVRFSDGKIVPIEARVIQVETAKERVNTQGIIGGIYPTANLSSTVAFYTLPFLCADPEFGVPVLGIKFLIARSPDPEIYFPAGTEVILQLSSSADFPDPGVFQGRVANVTAAEAAGARRLLSELPRQRADSGHNRASDLINVLFVGNRESINRAFHAAGWSGAQRGSLLSLYRIYHCMVQRMGYSMAPMRKLTLNGAKADAEYQKSLNTFSKRHHLRLWKQGDQDVWLGAATEDVGYEIRRMHVTHATDPLIDNERTKILNDLVFTGCVDAASLINRTFVDSNEPGRLPGTDGKVALIRINDCRTPRTTFSRDTKPESTPRSVQALLALRNDIVRSNPISLASNTIRQLRHSQTARTSDAASATNTSLRRAAFSNGDAQARWIRPSVLDETNVTIAAR
jgi:hypothetical protein